MEMMNNKLLVPLIATTLFLVPACTQVDISTGGSKTNLCVGNDSLDCSESDSSNPGDDNNTTDTTNTKTTN